MLFSGDELFSILKKHLPKVDDKSIMSAADSILDTTKHWEEVELHDKIHLNVENQMLHDICHKHAENQKKKKIRIFYTHDEDDES